jgi:Icc-related predicted phosphoesterase
VKILSVSDVEISFIYSPHITERFKDVEMVISCGDLPYFYLEYIISVLNKPLFHVIGNHAHKVEEGIGAPRHHPWGAIDLHRRTLYHEGLLMAGMQGSLQYNYGPNQYTQGEMWMMVWGLAPALFFNKLRYGRYLDIFVSHAPPWGVHDMSDRPHQGFKAFRWLHRVFRPGYHLHGHIHVYRSDTVTETRLYQTQVINTYGFRETTVDPAALKADRHWRKPGTSGAEEGAFSEKADL